MRARSRRCAACGRSRSARSSRIAQALDAADEYPEAIVDGLRSLGVFGFTIPREYGGRGHSLHAYCLAVEEIARGWMSVAGILNTHFIVASMLQRFGTDEQRARLLPRLASGELRAAFSMTEPHCGSDVQAIRTHAVRDGDEWVVTGEKRWQANGLRAGLMALLVKTDPEADPPHRGMTCLLLEKTPGAMREGGMEITGLLPKLGYLGIDSTGMRLRATACPRARCSAARRASAAASSR